MKYNFDPLKNLLFCMLWTVFERKNAMTILIPENLNDRVTKYTVNFPSYMWITQFDFDHERRIMTIKLYLDPKKSSPNMAFIKYQVMLWFRS